MSTHRSEWQAAIVLNKTALKVLKTNQRYGCSLKTRYFAALEIGITRIKSICSLPSKSNLHLSWCNLVYNKTSCQASSLLRQSPQQKRGHWHLRKTINTRHGDKVSTPPSFCRLYLRKGSSQWPLLLGVSIRRTLFLSLLPTLLSCDRDCLHGSKRILGSGSPTIHTDCQSISSPPIRVSTSISSFESDHWGIQGSGSFFT